MTRLACLLALSLSLLPTGCAVKPTEDECRKAIANMQRLMGTDNLRETERIESEVRRCKGGSKKAAVECAIKAQSLDDLRRCEFFKVPPGAKGLPNEPPAGSDPTGSAGSAAGSATGSAAAGSAAAGSAGSAATATGTGSATGSAAPTGSAASPGAAAGAGATGAGGAVGSAK